MNRTRVLAVASILTVAVAALAQQAISGGTNKSTDQSGVPTAETQLKFLAGKLDLTADQQAKITPILQELHDSTVKLVQDQSMSSDERMSKIREERIAADKKIRTVLTDEQKQKLDQVEHEPHPELHGNVTGGTAPQQQ